MDAGRGLDPIDPVDLVDAFVVAVADLQGGAVVATVDPSDMRRLVSHATSVDAADLDE